MTAKQLAKRCGSEACVALLPSPDPTAHIFGLLANHPDNICLNTYDPEYFGSLPDDDAKWAFLKCLNSGIGPSPFPCRRCLLHFRLVAN